MFHLVKYVGELIPVDNKAESEYTTVQKAILDNNWFAHIEMVILALLADEDPAKRKIGANLVKRARVGIDEGATRPLRDFKKPKKDHMNFAAKDYSELLHLGKIDITESPATYHFSSQDLDDIVTGKKDFKLKDIYCHTQATERAVANTTLAAASVVGQVNR